MERLFFSIYFTVRAIMRMRCLETQVPLQEQGACCEPRPAALKHRSPVQPNSQLCSVPACQATPQPAGGNLQLQHLSRINSSAPTLKASRCTRERRRGSLDEVWLISKGWKVVLLIHCSVGFVLFLQRWEQMRTLPTVQWLQQWSHGSHSSFKEWCRKRLWRSAC